MAPRRTTPRRSASGVRGHPYRSHHRTSTSRVRGQPNSAPRARTTATSADPCGGQHSRHGQGRTRSSSAGFRSSQTRGQRLSTNARNGTTASSSTTGERLASSAAEESVARNSSSTRSSTVRADAGTNLRGRGSRAPLAPTRRSSRLQGTDGTSNSPSQSDQPAPADTTGDQSSRTSNNDRGLSGSARNSVPLGGLPAQGAQQGSNNSPQDQVSQQDGNGPTPTPLLSTGRFSAYYVGRANHFYSDLLSLTPQPTRDRGNTGYNLRRRWATRTPANGGGSNQSRTVPPRQVERTPAPPANSPPPGRLREGPVTRSQARLRQASQGTVWRQGRFRIRHPGPVEPGHEEDSMQHALDMLTDLSSPNNTRDEDTMSESSNGSDRSGIPGEALPENFLGFGPEFWQGRRLVSIRFVRDHSILDFFPATGNMYISSLDEPPRGLTPQEIESIPYRNFARSEEAKTCSICIVNYRTGNRIKMLPCSHEFHEACIKRWLREHENCPTCRQPVREADRTAAMEEGGAETGAAADAPAGDPPVHSSGGATDT